MKKTKGFTLIELITVIVILGIIAVVAAPKFIDISKDAHKAIFLSMTGAFKSNLEILLLQQVVKKNPESQSINGQTIQFKSNGWPKADSLVDCDKLWKVLLEVPEKYTLSNVTIDSTNYNGWVVSHFSSGSFTFCRYHYTVNSPIAGGGVATQFIYNPEEDQIVQQGITISNTML
jgi:prepilin-type N-terminal cleavage/methylation domain-containing protein